MGPAGMHHPGDHPLQGFGGDRRGGPAPGGWLPHRGAGRGRHRPLRHHRRVLYPGPPGAPAGDRGGAGADGRAGPGHRRHRLQLDGRGRGDDRGRGKAGGGRHPAG